jgi:hypothetical protein
MGPSHSPLSTFKALAHARQAGMGPSHSPLSTFKTLAHARQAGMGLSHSPLSTFKTLAHARQAGVGASHLGVDPYDGFGFDLRVDIAASVLATTSFQAAYHADMHVRFARNLAAKPDTAQLARGQAFLFGLGHPTRFTVDEFNAASGAACVAPTGVQLVNSSFGQSEHEAFASSHIEFANAFYSQLGHENLLEYLRTIG